MRDLLLTGVVALLLPFALRHTWVAVLLWTWLSVMNPHKLAFGFATAMPFAAIAAGTAAASLLFCRNQWGALRQPVVLALLLLLGWMGISTLFAFEPNGSWLQYSKVLKIQLMTLVAMVALTERRTINAFVWVNVLSLGFYGVKGGLFTIATGGEGRVWGPPGGFIAGNNELALALVMCLPLMNYLRLQATRRWQHAALLGMMGLSVVSAVGSQSRGALLALLAMGAALWLRSPRKLGMGVVLALAAITVLTLMPETWEARMRTIQTYDVDGSALGRINAWWTSVHIANARPTGGGFEIYLPDIFARFAPDPSNLKVAHSIYFSVLGEHGYIGLALFLAVWLLSLRLAGQIRAQARQHAVPWAFDLATMCQVALAGYAVGGAFLSLAYFDLPYNLVVMLVATRYWLVQQAQPVQPAAQSTAVTLAAATTGGAIAAGSARTGSTAATAAASPAPAGRSTLTARW